MSHIRVAFLSHTKHSQKNGSKRSRLFSLLCDPLKWKLLFLVDTTLFEGHKGVFLHANLFDRRFWTSKQFFFRKWFEKSIYWAENLEQWSNCDSLNWSDRVYSLCSPLEWLRITFLSWRWHSITRNSDLYMLMPLERKSWIFKGNSDYWLNGFPY